MVASCRNDEEVKLAREIVERHRAEFPPFITDYNVVLGRSDGEPALFVLYKADGEDGDLFSEEWITRANQFGKLDDAVLRDLIEALDQRFPFSLLVPDWRWNSYPD